LKLYEISNQYFECVREAEDCAVPEDYIKDTLAAISGEFHQKADNIACLIKNLRAESKAIKKEAQSLRERASQKDRSIDSLLEYLKTNMILLEKHAIETPRNKIRIRKNPKSLEISDEFVSWAAQHARHFLNYKNPEPDKIKIREAINAGENPPYVKIIQADRLEIK
jgi:hypothetical protein